MHRSFDKNLALYARLIVSQGLGLARGQELVVVAEIDQAALVRKIAEEAYRAGAKNVEVLWSDPQLSLVRFREGSAEAIAYAPAWIIDGTARAHRENAARLAISSSDPGLLANVDPAKVAAHSRAQAQARTEIQNIITRDEVNWCLIGGASEGWAKMVFPDETAEQAVAKLWECIFFTSRVLEDDPIAAWKAHRKNVALRKEWLNGLKLDALHFEGPGTDLRVGLVPNHRWVGVESTMKNGVTCSPNVPTEEIFTMPHRLRVKGTVSSSKPLSLRGQVVDGISVEFKDGLLIGGRAEKGDETLQRLLSTDEGAKRLGEVALVPKSSRIAQTGVLFCNSLYDENAASHIAFGASYAENLQGYDDLSAQERLAAGANDSMIHIDWMIGSGEMDVDGIWPDGAVVELMRNGEWVDVPGLKA